MKDHIKEILAPDTLNLEGRALAAMNAIVGVADEDYGYIPYFSGFLTSDPAWMSHGNWDLGSSHGRLVDAMIVARTMTGTHFGEETEQHYRDNLLSFFHEDGLSYRQNTFTEEELKAHDSRFEESASMIDQRAVMLALTCWLLDTGEERVKAASDKLVAGLKKIAVKHRDSWFYPGSEYTAHGWPSFDMLHTNLTPDGAAMWGRQVMPFVKYYEATGNRDALELSENFIYNIVHRSGVFNPDGSFNGGIEHRNGHFHTRMGTLGAIVRFASLTHDAYLMNFAKRSYDWALTTQCTSFGWTPGDMQDQAYEHETCTLVDSIAVAIGLAKNGYPEYWSVVERFVRNQLTGSQLMDVSWIKERNDKTMDTHGVKTYYNVAQRLRGAFAGYAAPNDFVNGGIWGRGHIMDVQTCCVGSGTRGLYSAWSNIVTEEHGRVSVNLLLNRSTPKLDVLSYLPHEGRVELHVNAEIGELMIRIPEWVPYGMVKIQRAGSEEIIEGKNLPWVNTWYMKLGAAKPGEIITITFPVAERKTREHAVNLEYDVVWRGDDVIHIEPEGTVYPLFNNRKIYENAPMVKTTFHNGKGSLFE